jgi:long-chain acyl-CoA synthetase
VAARIELVNAQLAGFEQIKRYKIFAREWSVDTGELTPSLKLRRKFLETRHQIELKELYHDA